MASPYAQDHPGTRAPPGRPECRHAPLHPELHALGRTPVRSTRRRPVQVHSQRPGVGGDGPDRAFHRAWHSPQVGQGTASRHHHHCHRAALAVAGRHDRLGRRHAVPDRRADDLQGCAAGKPAEHGLDLRLHQRVVDTQGRLGRHLPVPPVPLHGTTQPGCRDPLRQRQQRVERRDPEFDEVRLHPA
ncbi:hypothetical protein D3C78_1318540 [compost metagenome]